MYQFKGFTEKANQALNFAIDAAKELGHTYIGSEHMLLGILKEDSGVAAEALTGQGVTYEKLESLIKEEVGTANKTNVTPDDFTPRSKRILQKAMLYAARLHNNYVGTEHLLLAILEENDSYGVRFLESLGVHPKELFGELGGRLQNGEPESAGEAAGAPGGKAQGGATKTLDQFGRDLTALAKKGEIDPVIGRQTEIDRVGTASAPRFPLRCALSGLPNHHSPSGCSRGKMKWCSSVNGRKT